MDLYRFWKTSVLSVYQTTRHTRDAHSHRQRPNKLEVSGMRQTSCDTFASTVQPTSDQRLIHQPATHGANGQIRN